MITPSSTPINTPMQRTFIQEQPVSSDDDRERSCTPNNVVAKSDKTSGPFDWKAQPDLTKIFFQTICGMENEFKHYTPRFSVMKRIAELFRREKEQYGILAEVTSTQLENKFRKYQNNMDDLMPKVNGVRTAPGEFSGETGGTTPEQQAFVDAEVTLEQLRKLPKMSGYDPDGREKRKAEAEEAENARKFRRRTIRPDTDHLNSEQVVIEDEEHCEVSGEADNECDNSTSNEDGSVESKSSSAKKAAKVNRRTGKELIEEKEDRFMETMVDAIQQNNEVIVNFLNQATSPQLIFTGQNPQAAEGRSATDEKENSNNDEMEKKFNELKSEFKSEVSELKSLFAAMMEQLGGSNK